MALYLGMDPSSALDSQLMWIAEEALLAPLPDGWHRATVAVNLTERERALSPRELAERPQAAYYWHESARHETQWHHPLDEFYRSLFRKERAALAAREGSDVRNTAAASAPQAHVPPPLEAEPPSVLHVMTSAAKAVMDGVGFLFGSPTAVEGGPREAVSTPLPESSPHHSPCKVPTDTPQLHSRTSREPNLSDPRPWTGTLAVHTCYRHGFALSHIAGKQSIHTTPCPDSPPLQYTSPVEGRMATLIVALTPPGLDALRACGAYLQTPLSMCLELGSVWVLKLCSRAPVPKSCALVDEEEAFQSWCSAQAASLLAGGSSHSAPGEYWGSVALVHNGSMSTTNRHPLDATYQALARTPWSQAQTSEMADPAADAEDSPGCHAMLSIAWPASVQAAPRSTLTIQHICQSPPALHTDVLDPSLLTGGTAQSGAAQDLDLGRGGGELGLQATLGEGIGVACERYAEACREALERAAEAFTARAAKRGKVPAATRLANTGFAADGVPALLLASRDSLLSLTDAELEVVQQAASGMLTLQEANCVEAEATTSALSARLQAAEEQVQSLIAAVGAPQSWF